MVSDMTASYKIPVSLEKSTCYLRGTVAEVDFGFVIPVYNDAAGLKRTLKSMEKARIKNPITVVDDGSSSQGSTQIYSIVSNIKLAIQLIKLTKNYGASKARNVGINHTHTDWVCFVDCDCEIDENYISTAILILNGSPKDTVSICGAVKSLGKGEIALYMEEQGILNPPLDDFNSPQAIVTANAIISKWALDMLGGFDEIFPSAGGEDIDLGIRLKSVGSIIYDEQLIVKHYFSECINTFRNRFRRYGRAASLLEKKWSVDWKPRPVQAMLTTMQRLANIQHQEMLLGYEIEAIKSVD